MFDAKLQYIIEIIDDKIHTFVVLSMFYNIALEYKCIVD